MANKACGEKDKSFVMSFAYMDALLDKLDGSDELGDTDIHLASEWSE